MARMKGRRKPEDKDEDRKRRHSGRKDSRRRSGSDRSST